MKGGWQGSVQRKRCQEVRNQKENPDFTLSREGASPLGPGRHAGATWARGKVEQEAPRGKHSKERKLFGSWGKKQVLNSGNMPENTVRHKCSKGEATKRQTDLPTLRKSKSEEERRTVPGGRGAIRC